MDSRPRVTVRGRPLDNAALFGRLFMARLDEARSGDTGVVSSIRTVAPIVALTFDDGPEPDGTRASLAALGRHGARGTYFVLGGRARRHPDLLVEIAAAGHDIGFHGPDHRLTSRLPAGQVVHDVLLGIRELEEQLGRPVRWYRPPYGQLTREVFEALRSSGITTVFWNRDARDWEDVPRATRVTSACRFVRPGSILLLHDAHADETDGAEPGPVPPRDVEELVDDILTDFVCRGLRSVTLTELFAAGSPAHRSHFARTPSVH